MNNLLHSPVACINYTQVFPVSQSQDVFLRISQQVGTYLPTQRRPVSHLGTNQRRLSVCPIPTCSPYGTSTFNEPCLFYSDLKNKILLQSALRILYWIVSNNCVPSSTLFNMKLNNRFKNDFFCHVVQLGCLPQHELQRDSC